MIAENISFIDNGLTPEIMSVFRRAVGWPDQPQLQYSKAFENSLFSVLAVFDNKPVGIGRLIGDGFMDFYVKDIIILPEYQRMGIGKLLMGYLLDYISNSGLPCTTVTVTLLAAKGKEPFYEKLGFRTRPNDREGAGMILNQKIDGGVFLDD